MRSGLHFKITEELLDFFVYYRIIHLLRLLSDFCSLALHLCLKASFRFSFTESLWRQKSSGDDLDRDFQSRD